MDHQEIKDLLELAALDRLEDDEARAVSEHLRAGCGECEAELRGYRETAASLALALEPLGSPARIIQGLEERLGLPAAASPGLRAAPPRSGATAWRIATGIAAVAFVAASVFAGFLISRAAHSHLEFERQNAVRETQLDALRSKLASSRQKVDTLDRVLNERARLDQVLFAPDLRLTRLEPLKPAPGGAGLVAVSTANGTALIQVTGLPATPAGKTYELWWITKESGPVQAGLFQVQRPGTVIAAAEPPPAGQHALLSAVTLEPAGGSNSPTGPMYLKGAAG
jgi:anti-sigma-K factor RskA